jgi:exodeoxyribonuclease VII small subunit
MDKDLAQMSFEAVMGQLKTTLDSLEKGELSLEESMKAYEIGVGLVKVLEEKLKNMEGRMEEILTDGSIKDLKISLDHP